MNPLQEIFRSYPLMILDGAFATELERRGCDLGDPLWSAKVLIENPGLIGEVHGDYLAAGADCVITASYQASFEGFARRGLTEQQAHDLIRASVTIAVRARDAFWEVPTHRKNRPKPLVAASVGPYGAYLADGSEYRGEYGLGEDELIAFHRRRLATLISAGPDILACETIPCLTEAKALVRLLAEHPKICCWMSFSARDGLHVSSGERLRDCARWLNDHAQVAAVGVNCTPPEHISSLIAEIKEATDKPIVVYPNSGEHYDVAAKTWRGLSPDHSFGELARAWYEQGARLIGGCCRTTPEDIRAISAWAKRV